MPDYSRRVDIYRCPVADFRCAVRGSGILWPVAGTGLLPVPVAGGGHRWPAPVVPVAGRLPAPVPVAGAGCRCPAPVAGRLPVPVPVAGAGCRYTKNVYYELSGGAFPSLAACLKTALLLTCVGVFPERFRHGSPSRFLVCSQTRPSDCRRPVTTHDYIVVVHSMPQALY